MSEIDDLVNRWFIKEWTESDGAGFYPKYRPLKHGEVGELEVVTTDGAWECGCYSSWTRDDQQRLIAVIKTRHGEIEVEYGTWGDFPDFVLRIIEFGELEDYCSIERRINRED